MRRRRHEPERQNERSGRLSSSFEGRGSESNGRTVSVGDRARTGGFLSRCRGGHAAVQSKKFPLGWIRFADVFSYDQGEGGGRGAALAIKAPISRLYGDAPHSLEG